LPCAQVVLYATPKNAAKGVARLISEAAAAAVKAKGSFTLVLSGGSVLSTLSGLVDAKVGGRLGADWRPGCSHRRGGAWKGAGTASKHDCLGGAVP
jgi:hypothetical protein